MKQTNKFHLSSVEIFFKKMFRLNELLSKYILCKPQAKDTLQGLKNAMPRSVNWYTKIFSRVICLEACFPEN